MTETIRSILERTIQFPPEAGLISDTTDLYAAGMSSFASVQLMLALEEAFDVEFPDRMLTRRLFSSIAAIREGLSELLGETVEA